MGYGMFSLSFSSSNAHLCGKDYWKKHSIVGSNVPRASMYDIRKGKGNPQDDLTHEQWTLRSEEALMPIYMYHYPDWHGHKYDQQFSVQH